MADKYKDGKVESIRNSDGIWINSNVFREEAIHFNKYGYFCADPTGSPAWFEYWREQRKRCIQGYTVGGATITGEHYFYLNFCPMQKIGEVIGNRSTKVYEAPDFWDGDYNYFWAREISKNGIFNMFVKDQEKLIKATIEKDYALAQEIYDGLHLEVKIDVKHLLGGYNMIVAKARRRGYSYKAAAIASKNYFTTPKSLTIFLAEDKKYLYPKGVFTMSASNINFINTHTGWATPSDEINRQDHIKASYITYSKTGNKIVKGFESEIVALTCKDNPDAARGKDALDVFIEEAGAFGTPGLLQQTYRATEDCVKAGNIKTGMITIWGTSGDMDGGTYDFSDMFKRPSAFDLLPFKNIWDDNSSDMECGFFHSIDTNLEGFYDAQGNSNREAARQAIIAERERLIKYGATNNEIALKMQEKPLGPAEAFASAAKNNFPVVELEKQKSKVVALGLQQSKAMPVDLIMEGNNVIARPILSGKAKPITSVYNLPIDKSGCVLIYEHPVTDAPKGLYKIGYDPVRQDSGSSLAAIIVYKGVHKNSLYHSCIVAEFIGRPESAEECDIIAMKLAIFYNTQIMYENEVPETKNYFRRIKRLDLLAAQPDGVISKNIKKTKVARIFGCHMNDQLKNAGERYVKDWLLTVVDYDENEKPIHVFDRIYSLRLLEELIMYHRKGNFDLVSALFMCMIQVQEEYINTEYDETKKDSRLKKLSSLIGNMYQK